jgi:hypothetical protein
MFAVVARHVSHLEAGRRSGQKVAARRKKERRPSADSRLCPEIRFKKNALFRTGSSIFSGFDPSVEPYQCAFTPDMKRLLVICDNGTYHRYRLRLAKDQEPLHEHSVNFLSQS